MDPASEYDKDGDAAMDGEGKKPSSSTASLSSNVDTPKGKKEKEKEKKKEGGAAQVFPQDSPPEWQLFLAELERLYPGTSFGAIQGGSDKDREKLLGEMNLSLVQRMAINTHWDHLKAGVSAPTPAPDCETILKLIQQSTPKTQEQYVQSEFKWTLARPAWCLEFQLPEELKARYRVLLREMIQNLHNVKTSSDRLDRLVFATLGCPGIGKSRLCDEIHGLLFPGQQTIVLKVTYNIVSLHKLDRTKPADAFLWRIVAAAASHKVPEFSVAAVPVFLEHVKNIPIDFNAMYALLQGLLPSSLPWILVVDEIVNLTTHGPTPEARAVILSHCSEFVRRSKVKQLPALPPGQSASYDQLLKSLEIFHCCLVTSFSPTTIAYQTQSLRPPLLVPQFSLNLVSCQNLAKQMFGGEIGPEIKGYVQTTIFQSGGHPRALLLGLEHLRQGKGCMSWEDMAARVKRVLSVEDVFRVYLKSFQLCVPAEEPLLESGIVLYTPTSLGSGWLSIPIPILFSALQPHVLLQPPVWLMHHIVAPPRLSAPKEFEQRAIMSDILRAVMREGRFLPERFTVHNSMRNWSRLVVRPEFPKRQDFFVKNKEIEPAPGINFKEPNHFIGRSDQHPHVEAILEAVCPTNDEGWERCQVFYQIKINAKLSACIESSNKAVELARAHGWERPVLLVIILGKTPKNAGKKIREKTKHPTVFVGPQDFKRYFSATLAHMLELICQMHETSEDGPPPPSCRGEEEGDIPKEFATYWKY
jgi:hypothetical protein